MRIIDVDGDGRDEIADGGYVLESDGTVKYDLSKIGGVIHGDRFHITDMDTTRPGLEGWGIQQDRVGDWDINAKSRNTYSWRRSFDGLVQARGALPFFGIFSVIGESAMRTATFKSTKTVFPRAWKRSLTTSIPEA